MIPFAYRVMIFQNTLIQCARSKTWEAHMTRPFFQVKINDPESWINVKSGKKNGRTTSPVLTKESTVAKTKTTPANHQTTHKSPSQICVSPHENRQSNSSTEPGPNTKQQHCHKGIGGSRPHNANDYKNMQSKQIKCTEETNYEDEAAVQRLRNEYRLAIQR